MSQEEIIAKAKECVLNYNVAGAKAVAQQAIDEKVDLVAVINEGFTAGITEVGALFEAKKLFLPHIMAAANAMNAGVDILTPEIEKAGASNASKMGKFVICTIEGDIHSIGKDIVAVMMKVAGFDIVNLGKDVALKDIVAACKNEKPVAVGTSALMTSTMVNQKTLEDLLKEEGIRGDLKTNVGGAPTSQGWADEIGADIYSENAMDCVAKVKAALGH